ncbi:uncharacterized protein APUU_12299A [Aspergillus puulaauensis]|uniref:SH3 domain-containing protein n=1 Tax=Aspergillus puulaauensis TaxID=1220207 RepID=A0A7R7XDK8_9EURO|nr:uncharacterized protein APUU_12299A [Aspergillus puulaauensis]BCS19471.1 hypothetical protein APUU_12299A [Aspergillus puulaauensis]
MASAGGSYWGAQGSQSQGSSQGSAQSVNGMYQAGNSANAGTAGAAGTAGTAGTGGSAGTAGAGAGTDAGTSGTNGATEGSAGTGGTAGTSGTGTGTSGSGSQYAGSTSQSNGQAGTGQQASTNQVSGSQAQGTAQGTGQGSGQGSGQSSSGAYYGTGSTGSTQSQTNGQSQWSGQGQTSQGQTVQGQQESQANTQPAAQNSNWNANSNSNALNSGSQSSSQSGYDDGMWHGNEQSTSGQNQKSQTNKDTNALNQGSTESKDSTDSTDSKDSTNSANSANSADSKDSTDSTDSKASTDSTKPEKDQMNDGKWHPELWSESATDTSSTTKSTNSPSSTHSDLPSTESPALPSSGSHRLSPGAEAGIAVGVMSLVLLLLGLIFYRLHRKKRALQMAVRSERNLPPLEKQNHMYNLASNLYTKSSLTLVGMSDTFKGRGNNSDGSLEHQHQHKHPSHNYNTNRLSIHDGPAAANESTSTFNSAITQLPPPVLLTGQTHPALRRPTWKARSQHALSPFTATASYAVNKVKALRQKELSPAQRRSLQAHEYGFSEEFLHIPPPPEPTRRLPRVLSKVQENGSLTVRAVTQKLNRSQTSLARSQQPQVDYQAHVQEHPQAHMQPPPPAQVQEYSHCQCGAQIPVQPQTQTQYQAYIQPQAPAPVQPQAQPQAQPQPAPQPQPQPQRQTEKANNGLSSWGTMNSLNSVSESSEEHREGDTSFPSPCEMIGEELFKVRSVSSGTVAMNNPAANISVDALAGRISGENEQPERSKSSKSAKSAKSTQSQSQSQQPQHARSPPQSKPPSPSLPTQPSLAEQPAQAEVPSIKPWSVHVYRVDMPFAARSTGHLEVSEGMMVRLDQAFDDGWALCTVAQTDQRGLIPRACLSTWPLKERRNYATSVNDPHIRNASSASLPISPVDSIAAQSFRFYRQASSRPGTPKEGVISPTSSTRSGSGSGSGS